LLTTKIASFNIHIILYISQVVLKYVYTHGVANYYKPSSQSSGSITHTSCLTTASLVDHNPQKHQGKYIKDDHALVI
jgi:hypothetical protein